MPPIGVGVVTSGEPGRGAAVADTIPPDCGVESCRGFWVAVGVEVAAPVPEVGVDVAALVLEVGVDVAESVPWVAMVGPWKLLLPS